jgi:hypothetical protein
MTIDLFDRPLLLAIFGFLAMWLAAIGGARLRRRRRTIEDNFRQELNVILTAALTMLGVLVGFTFSMAASRYDLRKNYEEAEANAIGTEYLRVEMLSPDQTQQAHSLLRRYLDQRILFYLEQRPEQLARINSDTARLQTELWESVRAPAELRQTNIAALIASGMNDVINMQGWVQAVWWNRIPASAWVLMLAIGVCSNILFGYNTLEPETRLRRLGVLPLILAIAFFLIADIESPRHGAIRVAPENLIALSQSMAPR